MNLILKSKIEVESLEVLGESDPDKFPIQPKKHSFEFLRENAHLRVRTKTIITCQQEYLKMVTMIMMFL